MTAGGLDPQEQWKSISYIPYEMMHKKWQYHLLNMLRDNIIDPAVEKDIDRAWREYPKGFVAFLQDGEVPPGGQGLAQYLAKYVVSPPISVRRIESYDGETIYTIQLTCCSYRRRFWLNYLSYICSPYLCSLRNNLLWCLGVLSSYEFKLLR